MTGAIPEALDACLEALRLYRTLGDVRRQAEQLRQLSGLYWYDGRRVEADEAAAAAVELLEPLPPGPELAGAYATMAGRRSIALDPDGAVEWGERAIALASELGEHPTAVRAMITVGTAEGLAGRGTERIRRGLERAIELDLEALVAYGVWARWASSASC